MDIHPVVIIGGGPAGLSTAIQLARQGQQALVLERSRLGGLLWNANLVENYPGFVTGISGPDLAKLFLEHAKQVGVRTAIEEVRSTVLEGNLFLVETNKRQLRARFLVAATGTLPRQLENPQPDPAAAELVFSEVVPLLDVRGKELVIIGAGDAAFDYALNLAENNRVKILNRGSEIRALPLLVERARKHRQIRYQEHTRLTGIRREADQLYLDSSTAGIKTTLRADFLITAIGRDPNQNFADPSIMREIKDDQKRYHLFLIGDLVNGFYRQTAIAVGEGIRTAMQIGHYVNEEKV